MRVKVGHRDVRAVRACAPTAAPSASSPACRRRQRRHRQARTGRGRGTPPSPTIRSAARCCSARRPCPGSARRRRRSPRSATRPRSNASGLTTDGDRRAVQHRDRVQALLPHDDAPAAPTRACPIRSPPARRDAGQHLLQALHRRARRRPTSAHRRRPTPASPCRTSCASSAARSTAASTTSRCCSTRPPSRGRRTAPQPQWNGKMLYSFGASTGQPRLQFRTEQNWADDAALSRGFMVVDNSLTDSLYNSNRVARRRDDDDDEGAHRRQLRRDQVHDGQRLLGRLDPARTPSRRSIRACSTASSRAATTPTRSPPASRSPTACCWSTPTSGPSGRR